MIVKLLIEYHLEFLSLKGGCRGSSESTLVKCHMVGNHMHWLKLYSFFTKYKEIITLGILTIVGAICGTQIV